MKRNVSGTWVCARQLVSVSGVLDEQQTQTLRNACSISHFRMPLSVEHVCVVHSKNTTKRVEYILQEHTPRIDRTDAASAVGTT